MTKHTGYIYRDTKGITVNGETQSTFLGLEMFKDALNRTNESIDILNKSAPELFEILGMRNLSAFIGEMFVSSLVKASAGKLVKNPHQDGYPDLLLMTDEGKDLWESLTLSIQEKGPFSGFKTGGIEVKATCGSVPPPDYFRKRDLRKPDIGIERVSYVRSYDWKAHHRETNNLIGIFWDFVDKKPVICGLFFSDVLEEKHWGKIIQPKAGGGRTTSVSIMTREGVFAMYSGWIAAIDDVRYTNFFNQYNRSNLIENHR